MGNHDEWFAHGLPTPLPQWMSHGEADHQRWTHDQIRPELRSVVARWPYHWHCDFDGVPAAFFHYALDASGRRFARIMRKPAVPELDDAFAVFAPKAAAIVFYGHSHEFSDAQGRARYVNPGSLGCTSHAVARYSVVEFGRGTYHLEHRCVPYDDAELWNAFEARRVPERAFIYRAFFGGRFPSVT